MSCHDSARGCHPRTKSEAMDNQKNLDKLLILKISIETSGNENQDNDSFVNQPWFLDDR